MKALLFLASFLLVSASALALSGATPARAESVLSAPVSCRVPGSEEALFQGRIDVLRAETDNGPVDTAVVVDDEGYAHDTRGFGLTGEITIIPPEQEPITRHVELGQGQTLNTDDQQLVECYAALSTTESRELTDSDVDGLYLDPALAGVTAEIETSVYGVAWTVVAPRSK